jgi:DNA modification methylase
MPDDYTPDEASGDAWRLLLGDSCDRLNELDRESVDLSIYSPPFASLYTYSPSARDIGNCRDLDEFIAHYRFVIDHVLRLTKPGRLSAVHVAQTTTQKARDGHIKLTDLRSAVIAAHEVAGWHYFGEATIGKDPQAQAIRTHSHSLLFVQLERDSAMSRPALADYLLVFKKPGENAVPITPVRNGDMTREDWIDWAHPCWLDIKETATLNAAEARERADERHICPLQLPLIDRCVRLWSNPGELVLSPFAGIGSEGYQSLLRSRRFVGCELKRSYYETAIRNLERAERKIAAPSLL